MSAMERWLSSHTMKQVLTRAPLPDDCRLLFVEVFSHLDLGSGKGRIIPYSDVPLLRSLRQSLPQFFGPKANGLYAEASPLPCIFSSVTVFL